MSASGRSAHATNASRYERLSDAPPDLPQEREGWGVIPTSATGWKYVPFAPVGSSPRAWNWAAMYSAARRPPRVAGARPSSRSLARKRRCASMAAVSTGMVDDRCATPVVAVSASITTVFQHLRVMCHDSIRDLWSRRRFCSGAGRTLRSLGLTANPRVRAYLHG